MQALRNDLGLALAEFDQLVEQSLSLRVVGRAALGGAGQIALTGGEIPNLFTQVGRILMS
jgi:hypothetical protein